MTGGTMNLICKLFNFILNIFEGVVTVVASALKTVGSALVDVLSDVWDNTLGSGSFGGLLIGVGLLGLAYFMLTKEKDEKESEKPGPALDSPQLDQPDSYGGYRYDVANNAYSA